MLLLYDDNSWVAWEVFLSHDDSSRVAWEVLWSHGRSGVGFLYSDVMTSVPFDDWGVVGVLINVNSLTSFISMYTLSSF